MKPIIFIHTNDHQLIPAKVCAYSLRSRSKSADQFDIRLLRMEETPHLSRRFNQKYYWSDNNQCVLLKHDSQSFGALRRMVPQLMGFSGRALLLDPDIVAIGDVYELLSRDMHGKAILCRKRVSTLPGLSEDYSSAVMLLHCDQLKHWQWDRQVDEIFAGKVQMGPWLNLVHEPADTIGLIEDEWNHFDKLNEQTKLLHFSERSTQPWKTGLPRDDAAYARPVDRSAKAILRMIKSRLRGRQEATERFQTNPDPVQERCFFSLLLECLSNGVVSEKELHQAIGKKYIRADVFEILSRLKEELPTPLVQAHQRLG